MKNYVYYFYHQWQMSFDEADQVVAAIKNKDFNKFMEFYNLYKIGGEKNPDNKLFFPDTISVYDNQGLYETCALNQENFMKITESEYEGGFC